VRINRSATILSVVLIILASSVSIEGQLPPAGGARMGNVEPIVLYADSAHRPFTVAAPRTFARDGAGSAGIVVEYKGSWPADAKQAFAYAVDIWETQIDSPVPIKIEATWENLGEPDILGAAGPYDYFRDFTDAPRAGTWYPQAVANALAGQDLNDTDPEIVAWFNSIFDKWYFGTDGNPGDKYDFVSVVLHEICHGLGFIGSMDVDETGQGSWGWGSPYPFSFDPLIENGPGQRLTNTGIFGNPSIKLAQALLGQEGGVYFDGPNARAGNGGAPVKLFAPEMWFGGSSIYHVDEIYDGTANGLMTWSLSSGEAIHDPGPAVRGILADVGWAIDLQINNQVVGDISPSPGQTATLRLTVENMGTMAATSVVVTDNLPAELLSPSWSSSLAGVSVLSGTYVWSLPDLPPGASGVITVTGTISPSLPDDYAIWNWATVAADQTELNGDNNRSAGLLGGARVYMPLVLRGP
jgi:uncharacterized repeat protein (TIGR01451 family)